MSTLTVTAKKGKIKIDPSKEISRGGEGVVYEIDSKTVAKIYHDGVTPITKKKFEFLKRLDPNYFVAPIELVKNDKGMVIGYTMKYIDQTFFPLSNIYNKNFCKSNGITKKVKLKIIEKLIAAVKYAHQEDVVIGDLNPYNILVNDKGVIKLIDTDSYETPGFPHSQVLLEDVRDYLYQGRVSKDSDFFALSVLSFNMLAFLHPFKGMHKQYKKIADRMIHKLPVFINNPDIKIPKCYEPIKDKNFINQFKKMYLNGDRFLLSLTGVDNSIIATSPLKKPGAVKKYEQDDLIITMIIQDSEEVLGINFSDNLGAIETDTSFIIYNSKNKGYLTQKHRLNKSDWDKVFVGNENIMLKKGHSLYHYKNGAAIEMTNFNFPDRNIITQMGNILIVIGPDNMYRINLDKAAAGTVYTDRTSVFGKGFNNHNGLIHNSAGKQNIFYNSGKDVSIVQCPVPKVIGVYQDGSVGIVQYIEKNKVTRKFFKIDGLKMKVSQDPAEGMNHFAYFPNIDSKGAPQKEGMILFPEDDNIAVYRTNDFAKISDMKCNIISSESVLKKTWAGIIVWDGNTVALLNKK